MRLTAKGKYAIIGVIDLSVNSGGGLEYPVRLQEISNRQNISIRFLEQIFRKMRLAGIVKSVRGPGGGYVLSRPINKISVKDVLTSVGENINLDFDCVNSRSNELIAAKRFLRNVDIGISKLLNVTIQQLNDQTANKSEGTKS